MRLRNVVGAGERQCQVSVGFGHREIRSERVSFAGMGVYTSHTLPPCGPRHKARDGHNCGRSIDRGVAGSHLHDIYEPKVIFALRCP